MKICLTLLLSVVLLVQALPAIADNNVNSGLTWVDHGTAPLSIGSPRMVLKNGNTLVVLDPSGMVDPRAGSPYGLFQDDTRFLSQWQILIDGRQPTLLTAFTQHGYEGSFLYSIGDDILIERDIVLLDGMSERIHIRSFVDRPLKFKVDVLHSSDFKDMFEVRGIKRIKFGEILKSHLGALTDDPVVDRASYVGVDKAERSTYVTAEKPKPVSNEAGKLKYEVSIPSRGAQTLEFRVDTSNTPENLRSKLSYAAAKEAADKAFVGWGEKSPKFSIDWFLLNDLVQQSFSDIFLLEQNTPKGPCLAAGLPWYSTAFGRDQCITALQTLPFLPGLSRDVIKVLAAYQGKEHDAVTEEEPGRIMHELRLGDMARSKEIAFRPYYGTVDATPLWLMLMVRYSDATSDTELARLLWPNIEAALGYIDKCTADSRGGFLFYGGKKGAALGNQAWKDSGDSIMHKNGELATAPIAVCEVQGYLYDAYEGCARLAAKLGHESMAQNLRDKAKNLKENFRKAFWQPDERIVALALDSTDKPCDVVASNAGHLLSSGIIDDEKAAAIAERLMKPDMFSGWGIRTLSTEEVRYNPISYHDGSIWPHDNAMIVEGLAARGKMRDACTVLENLAQSARGSSDYRLPELFCGFPRQEFPTPVPYSVSCVPQAWAAGSVLQMLRSVLGIRLIDNKIHIRDPHLPKSVNTITLSDLHSGNSSATVVFKREPGSEKVTATSSSPDVIIEN